MILCGLGFDSQYEWASVKPLLMVSDLLYESESAIAYVSVSGTESVKPWQIQYVLGFEMPFVTAWQIQYA